MKRQKPIGFGTPKLFYKIAIATYHGGFAFFRFSAERKAEALTTAGNILAVMVNSQVAGIADRLIDKGFADEQIEQLRSLGQELESMDDREPHPEFLAKVTSKLAFHGKAKTRKEVADRIQVLLPLLKGSHFVATLYDPIGTPLKEFSNLIELNQFSDWDVVA